MGLFDEFFKKKEKTAPAQAVVEPTQTEQAVELPQEKLAPEESMSATELEQFTVFCSQADSNDILQSSLDAGISYGEAMTTLFSSTLEKMQDVLEQFDNVPLKPQGEGEMSTFTPKTKAEAISHLSKQNPEVKGKALVQMAYTSFPELYKVPSQCEVQ